MEHWLPGQRSSKPPVAVPSGQTVSDPVPVAKAADPSTPAREFSRAPSTPVPGGLLQRRPEIRPATGSLALTNSESPLNSRDLDQNREWARNFPDEALAWLGKAPDGEQRDAVAEIALPQLSATNAAAAMNLAERYFGNSTNRVTQYLLNCLAQQWAGQDFPTASNWALSQPAGEHRDYLVQRLAMVLSETKPDDAAKLVSEQMLPGPTQNEAAISVIYQWARKDANGALAWAESFPAGDLRDRAISEVKNVVATSAGNPTAN